MKRQKNCSSNFIIPSKKNVVVFHFFLILTYINMNDTIRFIEIISAFEIFVLKLQFFLNCIIIQMVLIF
jgi:hypothetical protein